MVDSATLKTCSKCLATQSLGQFNSDKSRADGKFPQCRTCTKSDKRAYYEKNKESHMAYSAQWRRDHPDATKAIRGRYQETHKKELSDRVKAARKLNPSRFSARQKKHYESHREAILNRQKESREKFPERFKEIWNRYAGTNRDAINRKSRELYAANPEKHNAMVRRWFKENRDKALSYVHARRARKLANGGAYTRQEWESLKLAAGFMCLKCGNKEPDIRLTVDHVIPLIMGGSNNIDNIQPLCGRCNQSKGKKHIDYRTH